MAREAAPVVESQEYFVFQEQPVDAGYATLQVPIQLRNNEKRKEEEIGFTHFSAV